MKTVEEYLRDLPAHYNKLAILRFRQYPCQEYEIDMRGPGTKDALYRGFAWGRTPEKFQFWSNIRSRISDCGLVLNNCKLPQFKIQSMKDVREYETINGPLL